MALVYPNEKRLFAILATISIIIWLLVIIGTFGGALLYVLMFFLFYLFAQSAFISYIKGTGVRITREQFPDLYSKLESACQRLQIPIVPESYLLNSDGILNALATRFLGRNFLVFYSDIVDALEKRPGAIDFYIGHELGHIRRNHLLWGPVLVFGSFLPLLGAGYSRAREYTCDLHGLACCAEMEDAQRAVAVLAAGTKRWVNMDINAYREQLPETGGFWMSLHELIGDYPWLVKRMEHITAVGEKRPSGSPRRNPFAWFLALFVPRLGTGPGSAASGLIVVAMIGILAAIAIPAYQDYQGRAKVVSLLQQVEPLKEQEYNFISGHGAYPQTLADIGAEGFSAPNVASLELGDKGTLILHLQGSLGALRGKTLEISPYIRDHKLYWDCRGGTLSRKLRPKECR